MAASLKLLKGPILQRIIVLVLLSLTGLGHSPDVCEAFKCHNCISGACAEAECAGGCQITRLNDEVSSGCGDSSYENVKNCLKAVLHPNGACAEIRDKDQIAAFEECRKQHPIPGIGNPKEYGNDKFCVCKSELCNCNGLLDKEECPGGGDGGNGNTGAQKGTGGAQGVLTGKIAFLRLIPQVIIIPLATSGMVFGL